MVVNKTSEYDKNAKEALMMDFKTTEELDSIAGRRFDNSFSYFIRGVSFILTRRYRFSH